jgi:ribosomal protein L20
MLAQLAVLDIASFNKVVELASQARKWGIGHW